MMARWLVAGALVLLSFGTKAEAQSLRGSLDAMVRQKSVAEEEGYRFFRTGSEVRAAVSAGELVQVRASRTLRLVNVSFPFATPEAARFVAHLGEEYHRACRAPLVVTSLTRPRSTQPRNASARSVHPAGLAIDLRIPRTSGCRQWLERRLLDYERAGVVEATRERRPPHFHVAVLGQAAQRLAQVPARAPLPEPRDTHLYRVASGDSLWAIARAHGTSVATIRALNGLDSAVIRPGQVLRVPAD